MAGRKRSKSSRKAILNAALEAANSNNTAVSIESIAREAGVGKQTIYRWWSSLGELILEALREDAKEHIDELDDPIEPHNLQRFLSSTFRRLSEPGGSGHAVRWLMARAQTEPEFREIYFTDFIKVRREALRQVIRSENKEKPINDNEEEFLIDLVYGAMWYRLLLGHGQLDDDFAQQLAQLVARELDRDRKKALSTEPKEASHESSYAQDRRTTS